MLVVDSWRRDSTAPIPAKKKKFPQKTQKQVLLLPGGNHPGKDAGLMQPLKPARRKRDCFGKNASAGLWTQRMLTLGLDPPVLLRFLLNVVCLTKTNGP